MITIYILCASLPAFISAILYIITYRKNQRKREKRLNDFLHEEKERKCRNKKYELET